MVANRVAALLAVLAWGLAAPAASAETLRVGVLRLASSGPVFIALDKGYFAAAGSAVELTFLDAAQPVAVAVLAGDIDIGVTGLTAGFFNLAGTGALKIVGAQSREEPGYPNEAYLAADAAFAAGLTDLRGLPGHSVAITQFGSTFHYSLGLLAVKLGFPLDRVRLVALQSMQNEAAALKGGQVDAAVLPATIALPMVGRGEAHLLGWVGDETPWQLGAVFVQSRTVSQRRAALAAFITAYRRGTRDYFDAFLAKGPDGKPREGSDAPALLAVIAKYTGQPPDQIRHSLPYVDPDGRLLVRDVYRQVAWYQSQGLVNKGVDASGILDLSFIAGQESGR
jgi:NitT/TauT family transport system substrate-binding protein